MAVFDPTTIDSLSTLISRHNIPHLLLSDSAGTPLLSVSSAPNSSHTGPSIPEHFPSICSQLASLNFGSVLSTTTFHERRIVTHANFSPLVVSLVLYEVNDDSENDDNEKNDGASDLPTPPNTTTDDSPTSPTNDSSPVDKTRVNVGAADTLIKLLETTLEPVRVALMQRQG